MRRVGIYSGSFNPIHYGHVALADYLLTNHCVDEIWFICTPQNPLKEMPMLSDALRLQMLQRAVGERPGMKVCTIEDELPRPSYTIATLQALSERYPQCEFHLIIGADNWALFDRWRQWQRILADYHLIVYPRPGYALAPVDPEVYPTVRVVDAPLHDLSSTRVRDAIACGESVRTMVPPLVADFIEQNHLYR